MFDVRARRVKVVDGGMRIYLDHNATAPLAPEARAAMIAELDAGNASSIHAEGRRARDVVERARDEVAALVGARREELIFTSGGTESNNFAVAGLAALALARDDRRRDVAVSAIEHPSVLGAVAALAARGFSIRVLPVDGRGQLDLDRALLDEKTALIALQLANHELGTIQPIEEMVQRARAAGALVFCDAVQAAGKVAVDARALGVDALTLSAHKLGGPKGVGAVYVRGGVALEPLLHGGHQEREQRPGTENVAAIAGFGAAAARARAGLDAFSARVSSLRDRLEAGLVALGARVHGAGARVPNTTNVGFAGVDGELLVAALDLEGVAVATGAACSSGSVEASPVVTALLDGDRKTAKEAVRFSLGWDNDAAEVDRVLSLVPSLLERIRRA